MRNIAKTKQAWNESDVKWNKVQWKQMKWTERKQNQKQPANTNTVSNKSSIPHQILSIVHWKSFFLPPQLAWGGFQSQHHMDLSACFWAWFFRQKKLFMRVFSMRCNMGTLTLTVVNAQAPQFPLKLPIYNKGWIGSWNLKMYWNMGVSKNTGTPKWNGWFGGPTPVFGNTHIISPF